MRPSISRIVIMVCFAPLYACNSNTESGIADRNQQFKEAGVRGFNPELCIPGLRKVRAGKVVEGLTDWARIIKMPYINEQLIAIRACMNYGEVASVDRKPVEFLESNRNDGSVVKLYLAEEYLHMAGELQLIDENQSREYANRSLAEANIAVSEGEFEAYYTIATVYLSKKLGHHDVESGMKAIRQGAALGSQEAQERLAVICAKQLQQVQCNDGESQYWTQKARETAEKNGHPTVVLVRYDLAD